MSSGKWRPFCPKGDELSITLGGLVPYNIRFNVLQQGLAWSLPWPKSFFLCKANVLRSHLSHIWTKYPKFVVTLTLNFQGQIWNLLYLRQKLSDCHETKSKHIDWTLGLKCDHWIWPWPWHWPWTFKIKYGICYISEKMVRLPRNEKLINRLHSRPQMWPSGLTLALTLTLNFQGQIWNLLYLSQNGPIAMKRKANISIEL